MLFELYVRIFVMQVTIILRGWFALMVGDDRRLRIPNRAQDRDRRGVPGRRRRDQGLARGESKGCGEAAGLSGVHRPAWAVFVRQRRADVRRDRAARLGKADGPNESRRRQRRGAAAPSTLRLR